MLVDYVRAQAAEGTVDPLHNLQVFPTLCNYGFSALPRNSSQTCLTIGKSFCEYIN